MTLALNRLTDDLPENVTLEFLDAPFSPLDYGRERWPEFRQWQLEQLPPTDYGVIWDDDQVLEYPFLAAQDLRKGVDLTYATKLFLWDSPRTYATHIPTHRSVFFFRRIPGDRFDPVRILHAPVQIHDGAERVVDLHGYLLDYGYMEAGDRARCWRDYKRAGKIDACTLALVRTPTLHTRKKASPKRIAE